MPQTPVRDLVVRFLAFAGLSAWCFALVVVRWCVSGVPCFRFLLWNLFLAGLPAAFSAGLKRAHDTRAPWWVCAAWFGAWLLFLPNAPYIVTDFIHAYPRPEAPHWFDVALFASFACTGLLFAFASVAEVQGVVRSRLGAWPSWLVANGALLLSGFGIYLGRMQRWNSWDTLAEPGRLLATIAARVLDPGAHPRTLAVTIVYGVTLCVGYLALRAIASWDTSGAPGPSRESPGRDAPWPD